jgi:hypothetical protein
MRRRWIGIGIAVALAAVAGGGAYAYYARGRQASAQPQRAADPGFALILAIRVLERDPQTRLSREQIRHALPFIKALKDVPPSDVEAAAAIARAVHQRFTQEQRAALEEARGRALEQRRAQGLPPGDEGQGGVSPGGGGFGPPGEGGSAPPGTGGGGFGPLGAEDTAAGPPGAGGAAAGLRGGAGLTDEERSQFRRRAFERMIRYLERRMRS